MHWLIWCIHCVMFLLFMYCFSLFCYFIWLNIEVMPLNQWSVAVFTSFKAVYIEECHSRRWTTPTGGQEIKPRQCELFYPSTEGESGVRNNRAQNSCLVSGQKPCVVERWMRGASQVWLSTLMITWLYLVKKKN